MSSSDKHKHQTLKLTQYGSHPVKKKSITKFVYHFSICLFSKKALANSVFLINFPTLKHYPKPNLNKISQSNKIYISQKWRIYFRISYELLFNSPSIVSESPFADASTPSITNSPKLALG